MNVGIKIRELRKENNLSQQELADQLHISRQSISRWELGSSTPDINTLQKIAVLFDVSIEEFLETSDESNTPSSSNKTHFKKNHLKMILPFALIVLALLFAITSYASNDTTHFYQTVEELEQETEGLTNQVYATMKNKNISLPYSITSFEELEKIENNIIATHDDASNLKIPKDVDASSLQTLQKRQENLLAILDRQRSVLTVYQPLNDYFEKDILDERGEFQSSAVINNETDSDDLLQIERNIQNVSNETLRRSFSRAISLIEEQIEVREYIIYAIEHYNQSKDAEEYERLKDDILMINDRELQNEMLQLIE